MRTMIVGNLGYIGPVLTAFLRKKHGGMSLVGYDTGYFSGCLLDPLAPVDHLLDLQIHADVRSVRAEHLIGIDQVIYLAAISKTRWATCTKDRPKRSTPPLRRGSPIWPGGRVPGASSTPAVAPSTVPAAPR
ncbi:hypothetical protein [Rhizobacter sp. Root404]|uniref:hypothetical protein n=1 Tax=Rhizobacter sp. Root404 TaxID=1736528 RepID=UPI000AB1549B|nr:hypothetical protein [Rhizobacter sp. Root404]